MREECPYVCCYTSIYAPPAVREGRSYVCRSPSIYIPPAVRESFPMFVAAPLFISLLLCGRASLRLLLYLYLRPSRLRESVPTFVAAPLSTPLSRSAGKGRKFLINFITALPEGVKRSESISHFQRSEPFKIIFFSPPAYGGRRKEYVNRQHGIPTGDAVLSVPLAKKANFPTNGF